MPEGNATVTVELDAEKAVKQLDAFEHRVIGLRRHLEACVELAAVLERAPLRDFDESNEAFGGGGQQ
jgi:hypothetical protein